MRTRPQIPCTGHVSTQGFADFLAAELGPGRHNLRLLESELKHVLGAPFLSLVNSGSSANLASAILLKERCDGRRRVLMAAFSFPTTISSYSLLGFEVSLVDTEPDGFNIDPDALDRSMDERVAAVVVTHFLGFPAQLGRIAATSRRHGALLIQDACETMNLTVDGRSLYEYGDLVTHSFYHPHHLNSFGGGAVVEPLPDLHDDIQSIVHWGRACRCHYDAESCKAPGGADHNFWYLREGINVEMSELNACFARWQLQSWPEQEARRWNHWRIWQEALADSPHVQTWPARGNLSPFVFPVGVHAGRRQAVTDEILARGVEVRTLMGGAIHHHPAHRGLTRDGLANCEAMGRRSFFTGIHQTLETEKVERAAAIVRGVLETV